MSIKLQLPKLVDVKPRLTVIGVGGAGCNAVNNMIAAGLQGVDFVVANTDAQSLAASSAEHRIQLGANLTEGLGAGSRPEIGEAAAEEAIEEIRSHVAGSHMVFIAAGMGGGTGTGAAAVIARTARDLGILTVGIVCKPFQFEGARRMRIADAGVQLLRQHVDTLIVIPNQNLFRIANERTTFAEAFVLADQVLYSGVACIVELVLKEGLINLDFADVKTVMSGMGTAMMGTGEATGERRAILAAEEAIANPLLDDVTLKGAKGLLLSITGGRDLTLYEVDEAASRVRQEVDPDANIIVGATFDDNLGDRLRVSIVASGMGRTSELAKPQPPLAAMTQGSAAQSRATAAPAAMPPTAQMQPAPAQYMPALQSQTHQSGAPFYPAPSQHPVPPPNDDMQRRLSEVLQASHSGQPVTAAPSPYGSQPMDNRPAPAPRETWSAPGNVSIEEGFAHIGVGAHASHGGAAYTPPGHSQGPQGYTTHQGFQAQPPVEAPRSSRRMPAVEDFPPVGQRDWHAKQTGSGENGEKSGGDQRKSGFFGRFGRKTAEAQQNLANSGNEATQSAPPDPALPVFFGRERR
ncbi:MAG: cell division protein FtsZ [Hyphomicrobium sp.]|nr:cell division protein FtsZ [Hyphomicrobium sp.]